MNELSHWPPQNFFLSVAERQDHAIQFSMWDIRENKDADDEHNKKLLGQFGSTLTLETVVCVMKRLTKMHLPQFLSTTSAGNG